MTSLPDRELAIRAQRGDAEAYGDLVQAYQNSVFNVCNRLLGERREAEELTQETFIRAYQRLKLFDPGRPFGPWIRRVAANLCLNHLQTRPEEGDPLDDERDEAISEELGNPESRRERAEINETVRKALMTLPLRYRAVVELRHFEELSYAEIGEALKIPLSDVKSYLFRARRMLAERLKTDV
jgi:RNA polymerase sigma-70 factor (ECF subfamily)